jgi:hypothetical protein
MPLIEPSRSPLLSELPLGMGCSIGATVLLIAPVSMHRLLFRRHRLNTVVSAGHSYAMIGMALLAVALAGVAVVIFDAVVGATEAWIAGWLHVAGAGLVLVPDAVARPQRQGQPILTFASR